MKKRRGYFSLVPGVIAFYFLQCSDTISWVRGRASGLGHLSPEVPFWNRKRKKTEGNQLA